MLSNLTYGESLIPFTIKITNGLPNDCILKDHTILYGHVSDHSTLPTIIHSNETTNFTMRPDPDLQHFQEKSILLTYACGSSQEITLYAGANTVSFANPEAQYIGAKTFYEQNMTATYEKSVRLWNHPALSWTLTN